MKTLQIVECPRDAMQGMHQFVPTSKKIEYINALADVGFHTLDCGSFVSPKAIPQMADTQDVLEGLNENISAKLLVIVANERGAEEACKQQNVSCLGYPYSISETFQQKNANSSIAASLERLQNIQNLCTQHNKELVVYLSMAFGNPYQDAYSVEILYEHARKLANLGIKTLSLADTVGLATPEDVYHATSTIITALPECIIGVHLHSKPADWEAKLEAALSAGCGRVDGALKGFGGCPMAGDTLVGNMDMLQMLPYLRNKNLATGINFEALEKAKTLADQIFI